MRYAWSVKPVSRRNSRSRWKGEHVNSNAAVDAQAFRFPVWDFNWPGAYQMVDGKPAALVQRETPVVAKTTPYALTYRLDFLAAAGTLACSGSSAPSRRWRASKYWRMYTGPGTAT